MHAFRSLKTVDLELRPVFHWTTPRVRAHAHVLLCMLAYYLQWHAEAHALCGKAVEVRRTDHRMAGAAEHARVVLDAQDEEQVRGFHTAWQSKDPQVVSPAPRERVASAGRRVRAA